MAASAYTLPGRIGDPDMTLNTEPRIHAGILENLRALHFDGVNVMPLPGLTVDELRPILAAQDEGYSMVYDHLDVSLPSDKNEPEVDSTTHTFKSFDGVERHIYITRAAETTAKAPAVVYIHGGGMVILSTLNPVSNRWMKSIALQGAVAIAIDFRNGYTKEKDNPFPTGLNDCVAALKYIHEHKEQLGISKVLVIGESGGANLAMASSLKAKRDGYVDIIDGIYASVPHISGASRWSDERKLKELPSLIECNGYFLEKNTMLAQSAYYAPEEKDHENPLAWPYYATQDDVKGLPPHMLVMDELDPLRDEGIAYYRKLAAAGVSVVGRVTLGTVHASSILFRHVAPEINAAAIREIVSFAKSL